MRLYDYIERQIKNGKSDKEIETSLLERGYSADKAQLLIGNAHLIRSQKKPRQDIRLISAGGIIVTLVTVIFLWLLLFNQPRQDILPAEKGFSELASSPAAVPASEDDLVKEKPQLPLFDEKQRILVFAAHEDDEAIGAGTIVSRAIKNGGNVTVVLATNGAPSEFGHGNREALIRRNETLKALSLAGVPKENIIFLGYEDLGFIFEINVSKEIARISEIIKRVNPTQIYTQAYEGGHIDHDAIHYLAVNAAKKANSKAAIYEYIEYNAFNWGSPIPEMNDTVDNNKYPLIKLNLDEDEKNLKKSMLKEYDSQNPFKNNLLTREKRKEFELLYLDIKMDNDYVSAEHAEKDEQYLKIGEFMWNNKGILTEFGKKLIGKENPTEKDIIDFFVYNSEKHVLDKGSYVCNVQGYDGDVLNMSKRKLCLISNYYEIDASCIYGTNDWPDDYYCESVIEHYNRLLGYLNDDMDHIKALYSGNIPENVQQKLRFGSYYAKTNNSDKFGGIINVRPSSTMELTMLMGSLLNNSLQNVEIRLSSDLFTNVAERKINRIEPQSVVISRHKMNIFGLVYEGIYEITIEISGSDQNGNKYEDTIYYNLDLRKKKDDIIIDYVKGKTVIKYGYNQGNFVDSLNQEIVICTSNIGLNDVNYTLTIQNRELNMHKNLSNYIFANSALCDFIYGGIPLGISGAFDLNVSEYIGNVMKGSVISRLSIDKNGDIEIEGIRPYNEVGLFLSSEPELEPLSRFTEGCEESYLICLYYWEDMIRPLPDYDYSKKPHASRLGYEKSLAYLNITKSFEDFVYAIKAE